MYVGLACVFMYVQVCMCVCMYVRMYVRTYVCMYVCIYVCIYVCLCRHVRMYVCLYICMCVCMYVYVCMCYMNMYCMWFSCVCLCLRLVMFAHLYFASNSVLSKNCLAELWRSESIVSKRSSIHIKNNSLNNNYYVTFNILNF